MSMDNEYQSVHLRLPLVLLESIDKKAQNEFCSRTALIIRILKETVFNERLKTNESQTAPPSANDAEGI